MIEIKQSDLILENISKFKEGGVEIQCVFVQDVRNKEELVPINVEEVLSKLGIVLV